MWLGVKAIDQYGVYHYHLQQDIIIELLCDEIHIKRTFLLPFSQYFLHRVLSQLPYVESGIHSDHPGRESEQEPLLQN